MITMNRPNTVSQVMHFCFASGILIGLMLMDIKFQIVCAVTSYLIDLSPQSETRASPKIKSNF